MNLGRRLAAAGAVLALGTAIVVTGGAAQAVTPNVLSNGVVGYSAVQNGNDAYFTDMDSYFGLGDPQYSIHDPQLPVNPLLAAELSHLTVGHWVPFSNPANVVVRAARIGLCGGSHSSNAGTTVQLLIVPISATEYDVVALEGQFAANGGNVCLNATLPHGEAALVLRHISDGDTTKLQILFDGAHAHNGAGAGQASFIAEDLTNPTTNQVNTGPSGSGPVFSHAGSEFYEAENGILGAVGGTPTASLGSTVLPDINTSGLTVKEAHVGLNANVIGGHEVFGSEQSNAAWQAIPDATQVNGVITGAVTQFQADNFGNYTAPGVFPVTP